MKKLYVASLVMSILLVQCYTQKEYLIKYYKLSKEDKLTKIVLSDSTVRELSSPEEHYQIESDCIIISRQIEGEKYGDYTRIRTITDTLRSEDIHSVFVSEYNQGTTPIIAGGLIGGLLGGLIASAVTPDKYFLGQPIPQKEKNNYIYIGVGIGAVIGAALTTLTIPKKEKEDIGKN